MTLLTRLHFSVLHNYMSVSDTSLQQLPTGLDTGGGPPCAGFSPAPNNICLANTVGLRQCREVLLERDNPFMATLFFPFGPRTREFSVVLQLPTLLKSLL